MLSARQLLAVWDQSLAESPPRRAAAVLAGLLDEDPTGCAGLDVGSRDVLLGRFLRELVGPTVLAAARCAGCGELLDVPVDLAAFGALPVHPAGQEFSVQVDDAIIQYRLPTTADVSAVAGLPGNQARAALLARCLAEPGQLQAAELVAAVEQAMEDVAPGGAVDLLLHCPECGHDNTTALDVPELLWAELEARAVAVLRDVHALAMAYGWTEDAVLSLTPSRRAAYLALADMSQT
jgi:hypothetical protein